MRWRASQGCVDGMSAHGHCLPSDRTAAPRSARPRLADTSRHIERRRCPTGRRSNVSRHGSRTLNCRAWYWHASDASVIGDGQIACFLPASGSKPQMHREEKAGPPPRFGQAGAITEWSAKTDTPCHLKKKKTAGMVLRAQFANDLLRTHNPGGQWRVQGMCSSILVGQRRHQKPATEAANTRRGQ